jgi:hypothetical protein
MRTIVTEQTAYKFDELSDKAKEKARDWYRGHIETGDYDAVIEDAVTIAGILGIDLAPRNQRCILTGPNPREWVDNSPSIFWSGFSSQGDGASFDGRYSYAKGCARAIRRHAPLDTELHRIADELRDLQRPNMYRLTATSKVSGHYSHSGCMNVAVDDGEFRQTGWLEIEEKLTRLMRDFADWIYRQLDKENTWLYSDEHVDESIECNDYEFTSEGEIV